MQNLNYKGQPVVSAIVQNDGQFLLVKRMNPPSQNMYAFPGGKVEPEETLEQAVLRELQEETGLVGAYPRLYRQYETKGEGFHYHLHVFQVDVSNYENLEAMDDAESLGWFSIEETNALSMPKNMIDCFIHLAKDAQA